MLGTNSVAVPVPKHSSKCAMLYDVQEEVGKGKSSQHGNFPHALLRKIDVFPRDLALPMTRNRQEFYLPYRSRLLEGSRKCRAPSALIASIRPAVSILLGSFASKLALVPGVGLLLYMAGEN